MLLSQGLNGILNYAQIWLKVLPKQLIYKICIEIVLSFTFLILKSNKYKFTILPFLSIFITTVKFSKNIISIATMKTQRPQQINIAYSFNQHIFKQILCIKENPASLVCFNKKCPHNAFICQNKNCQCRSFHKLCLRTQIQFFMGNLIKKSQSLEPLYKKIEEMFDLKIDQLSNLRDQILIDFKQKYQLQGLNENQLKFIKAIKNKQSGSINCDFMWNINVSLYQEQQKRKTLEQIQGDVKLMWSKFDQSMKEFYQFFGKYFENANQIFNAQFKYSKIIKSKAEQKDLINFFDKKIKSVQLIYRASQNQFSIAKFHEKCDDIENTLVLCQTNYNKIIGGYTPIKWKSSGNWQTNGQNKSFLFTLTNKDKLLFLPGNQYEIHCSIAYGPLFGGGNDFCISDKSNLNNSSFAKIGSSYLHKDYPRNLESYKKFSGGDNYHFSTKQWQVWKVEFDK